MDCRQVQPKMPDHSVGLLRPREADQMEAHLAICADCAREWRELQAVMGLVERLGAREPPPHLWNGVYNRITADVSREQPGFWERWLSRPRRLIAGTATGLAAAALVTALYFSDFGNVTQTDVSTVNGGSSTIAMQQHAMVAGMEPFADEVGLEAYRLLVDDPDVN
jgi:anti-sigma factor RsiW